MSALDNVSMIFATAKGLAFRIRVSTGEAELFLHICSYIQGILIVVQVKEKKKQLKGSPKI